METIIVPLQRVLVQLTPEAVEVVVVMTRLLVVVEMGVLV